MTPNDYEVVDDNAGVVVRRVVVGALDTNCWVVADAHDRTAVIVDPGDDATGILAAVDDLDVVAVVLTHCHWDHVLAVPEVVDALGVPVFAHPAERDVWSHECGHLHAYGHFDAGTMTGTLLAAGKPPRPPQGRPLWSGAADAVAHGDPLPVGRATLTVLHTPGHTPGGITLRTGRHLFTGDTLFLGGPGLTGWPLSDFPTIIESIRDVLFGCPDDTVVHPGHGPSTTIGTERPALERWIARGW